MVKMIVVDGVLYREEEATELLAAKKVEEERVAAEAKAVADAAREAEEAKARAAKEEADKVAADAKAAQERADAEAAAKVEAEKVKTPLNKAATPASK